MCGVCVCFVCVRNLTFFFKKCFFKKIKIKMVNKNSKVTCGIWIYSEIPNKQLDLGQKVSRQHQNSEDQRLIFLRCMAQPALDQASINFFNKTFFNTQSFKFYCLPDPCWAQLQFYKLFLKHENIFSKTNIKLKLKFDLYMSVQLWFVCDSCGSFLCVVRVWLSVSPTFF